MPRLLCAAMPLLALPLLAQGTPEAAEPNDTTLTATVLVPGEQGFGDITAGDEDWFKVTLASASDLKVWTSPGFSGQIGDTKVRILAADGTTVLIDVDDGDLSTHGYYTTFVVGNYAPGDYYVAVRGFSGTTAGTYTLDVVAAPAGTYVPPLAPIAEFHEDNDPRLIGGIATVSAVNTLNSGEILLGGGGASYTDPTADYDFYQVVIGTGGTLVMETLGGAPFPALADSVIFLVDAGLAVLASDDDGGAGTLSLLTYTVTPGTYYVVVKGWGVGFYDLAISMAPTGPATFVMRAGGCAGSAGTPTLGTRESSTHPGVRPELPILGSEFFVDGENIPANGPLMRVIGLDPLASPFDLTPYGAPGCQIEVDPLDQSFALADAAGVDFWGMLSPAAVALLGLTVEQQLAILDVSANGLGLTVSNRTSSVFGITH
ncbi:MAG: PPC domain-containing protein [Planctomycetes bacterium]|nr:PPC domain-containing protein [Planctomycetota bacterium]